MYMENEFEALLDKFYRGDTTLEEEQLLASFFSRNVLPEQWEADKNLFESLHVAATEMPEGLEQRMSQLIDSLEEREKSGKKIGIRSVFRRDFRLQIAGLVASLLVLATIGFWSYFNRHESEPLLVDTFENPEQAREATLEALQLFADNFSKGTHTVEQVDRQVDRAFGILRETLGQTVTCGEDPVVKQK